MGTNQSNCYHDYPKLEENMVSTVRCHHIRNDDNINAFLYILLSTILTEVDHRQMLSCMEVRSKKKKHISKRSNSRNIGTTKRCNIAASLFCNRSDSPYGISASLKTQLNWNLVSSLYPQQIVFLIASLVCLFTSLRKEDFTTFKCKSRKAISLSANIYGDDMS